MNLLKNSLFLLLAAGSFLMLTAAECKLNTGSSGGGNATAASVQLGFRRHGLIAGKPASGRAEFFALNEEDQKLESRNTTYNEVADPAGSIEVKQFFVLPLDRHRFGINVDGWVGTDHILELEAGKQYQIVWTVGSAEKPSVHVY